MNLINKNFKSAILLTCFNRKEKTIQCLRSLLKITNYKFDIYLVDDSSTDGTSEAISEEFPDVQIIKGNGNLYWSRGMHLAWKTASSSFDYDFYIWINDDIFLYDFGINEIFTCSDSVNNKCIISGIIDNIDNQSEILYGGYDKSGKLILPSNTLQEIYHMNGNVVLIPKEVFKKIGNIDPKYHHDLGDGDYGLRAIKNGIKIYSTRVPIASGTINKISRLRKKNTSLLNRFRTLYSPLGSPPSINFYYRKKHFGIVHAILFFIFQHFLILIPDSLNYYLFKNKYQ